MRISKDRPPNYDAILAAFPMASHPGVLFTYGDTLHNPNRVLIPHEIMRHEEVHAEQQRVAGAALWWERYLIDAAYRLDQERAAHVVEWASFRGGVPLPGRTARKRQLAFIAARLSGPLYGHVVDLITATRLLVETGGPP